MTQISTILIRSTLHLQRSKLLFSQLTSITQEPSGNSIGGVHSIDDNRVQYATLALYLT